MNEVVFYLNGERINVSGEDAFLPLANFLRYRKGLTGTKIVCAEGDCGACSVLKRFVGEEEFRSFNSCIAPVFLMHGNHLVTVEGLTESGDLSEVQKAMVRCFGSQCGFCTPGFVVALTDMFERKQDLNEQNVKNHLTGNLCRCTGYQPIISAALSVDQAKQRSVRKQYADKKADDELRGVVSKNLELQHGAKQFFAPTSLAEACRIRKKYGKGLRIYSGATDLGVRDNKLMQKPEVVLSLHLIPSMYDIKEDGESIAVGAKASLRRIEEFCRGRVPEFADFLRIFASPQIKETATLVGNLANGSPIADSLPFLFVADAEVICTSTNGERKVPVEKFFRGYKKFDLADEELISGLRFKKDFRDQRLRLYKISQRRDLDISCVNMAVSAGGGPGKIDSIKIALGGVAATPVRAPKTEQQLTKKALDAKSIAAATATLRDEITPISDVRGSQDFRKTLACNLLRKFSEEWQSGL